MSKRRIFIVSVILLTLVGTLIAGCDNQTTDEYTLTVEVNPSGGGTTSPAVGIHDYDDGTAVNITATAAAGYVFDHWSGAATGVTTSVSITMISDKSITANFAPAYQLTVNVLPTGNGNVTLSGEGPYKEDTKVTLTATPAVGYVFDHWSGAVTGDTNPVTLTMDANKTVSAYFASTEMYTLTTVVDPDYGGTVAISPLQDSYAPGTQVTLAVSLNSTGYTFEGWWMGSSFLGNENPITITMDSNKTIMAKIKC